MRCINCSFCDYQVAARDEALQRMNVEIGKLRAMRREKLAETARQLDMIKQLQEALSHTQLDLDETRRRGEEDVSRLILCIFYRDR